MGQPKHMGDAVGAGCQDVGEVPARGAVQPHAVDLVVAEVGARPDREVEVHVVDVRPGQVPDAQRVGAAQGRAGKTLDTVQVHDDVSDVPRVGRARREPPRRSSRRPRSG